MECKSCRTQIDISLMSSNVSVERLFFRLFLAQRFFYDWQTESKGRKTFRSLIFDRANNAARQTFPFAGHARVRAESNEGRTICSYITLICHFDFHLFRDRPHRVVVMTHSSITTPKGFCGADGLQFRCLVVDHVSVGNKLQVASFPLSWLLSLRKCLKVNKATQKKAHDVGTM